MQKPEGPKELPKSRAGCFTPGILFSETGLYEVQAGLEHMILLPQLSVCLVGL